jgi:hypothetical protein
MIRRLFSTSSLVLIAALTIITPATGSADSGPITQAGSGKPVTATTQDTSTILMAGPIWTIQNCDGRWEDFRVADNRSVEHRFQLSPGGTWSGWSSLGGSLLHGDLGVGRNTDCRIEVFGVGDDHAVWTTWQTRPSAGPWASPWASLGGHLTSAPSAATFSDGTLGVCAWGNDIPRHIWCNKHTGPGGTPWSGWFRL